MRLSIFAKLMARRSQYEAKVDAILHLSYHQYYLFPELKLVEICVV